MNKHKLKIGLVVLVIILALLACDFSASTANIKEATMARDKEGNQPTTVFNPEDTFYCLVELANAPDDTSVKAAWTVVQAEGEEPNVFIDETTLTTSSGSLQFELSNSNLWPNGKYKVDLYLNDELNQTLEFEVR